jgi:hypothetical protein
MSLLHVTILWLKGPFVRNRANSNLTLFRIYVCLLRNTVEYQNPMLSSLVEGNIFRLDNIPRCMYIVTICS